MINAVNTTSYIFEIFYQVESRREIVLQEQRQRGQMGTKTPHEEAAQSC